VPKEAKMGSGSTPVYALDSDDDDASTNRSISELISTLRIAYRSKDFDRVEAKLVARETRLKREIEDAKKENALLKDALDVAREKERRAEERYEKLLEEVKKGQQEEKSVLFELKRKNCELECALAKAESNAEFWKSGFGEFGTRISKLEEDYVMLVNDENVNKVNAVHVKMEDDAFDCDGNTSAIKGNTDLQNAGTNFTYIWWIRVKTY
jgi:chromosome segregation ATPase